jgi:hypothetical protein
MREWLRKELIKSSQRTLAECLLIATSGHSANGISHPSVQNPSIDRAQRTAKNQKGQDDLPLGIVLVGLSFA